MSFNEFGVIAELLKAVSEKGYTSPTPIQKLTIPLILEGSDLLAGSQTGTGKTAGFTLPLLQNLMKTKKERARSTVNALILVPTRELAVQVDESVKAYSKYLPLKSLAIFGGVSISVQIKKLKAGVDIVIATPGRLLDLVNQKALDLRYVEMLVLDEADRMLDMGFLPDIRRILSLLSPKRQNLLFSATFSRPIKELAHSFLKNPKLIELSEANVTVESISQIVHPVDMLRKTELLSHLILSQNLSQVLVFTRTKHGANRLSTQLEKSKIRSVAIHGNKSQGQRLKALTDFKNGNIRVLVATDIAARGLDIRELPTVVNFDLPDAPEDYVHRIGRTGRAGNEGVAISLVCIDEHKQLKGIERLLKREIPEVTIPNFQPDLSIKAEPKRASFGRKFRGQRDSRGFSKDKFRGHREKHKISR